MKKTTTLLILGLLVAAPLTGCIENMDDLKDRLSAAESSEKTDEPIDDNVLANETGDGTGNVTNTTQREFKPPVARVTVYAPGGALLFKSSFAAEDQLEPVTGSKGAYSLLAADSEALDSTARLDKFEWNVNGEALEGRKVEVDLSEPGIHMIVLTVTDTNGKTDSQMVHVGVVPDPFDVVTPFEGGTNGGIIVGTSETFAFSVADEVDGKTVAAQKLAIRLSESAPSTLDVKMTVYDADGEEVRSQWTRNLEIENPDVGDYTVKIFIEGATDSYSGDITVTYLEQIEGLGGDGHGGHSH